MHHLHTSVSLVAAHLLSLGTASSAGQWQCTRSLCLCYCTPWEVWDQPSTGRPLGDNIACQWDAV